MIPNPYHSAQTVHRGVSNNSSSMNNNSSSSSGGSSNSSFIPVFSQSSNQMNSNRMSSLQPHSNHHSGTAVFSSHSHTINLSNSGVVTVDNNNNPVLEIEWKMHSLVDSFLVELLSSMFVNLSVIFSWDWAGDNYALQFIPGISLGLIMLCLKDEDYFFPDGSPMVTCMLWIMGGYISWIHSCIRLMAHVIGFGLALWICISSPIPDMVYHKKYTGGVYFGMEAFTTAIEHIAIVYVVMPLLPPINSHGSKFLFPRFKPKSHPETMAPSNAVIMHAALIFATIHWVFWRMFGCEMNPSVLLLLTYLRTLQEKAGIDLSAHHKNNAYHTEPGIITNHALSSAYMKGNHVNSNEHWTYFIMGFWGQLFGLGISIIYAMFFVPRSHKFSMMSSYPSMNASQQQNKSSNNNKKTIGS